MTLPTTQLGATGVTLTRAGFGGAALAGMYRPCSEDQAQAALQAAWDGGIRYFDTAPSYGNGVSEERLGRFLSTKPRASFTVSTKAGRLVHQVAPQDAPESGFKSSHPARISFDYTGPGMRRSLESSLTRLGLTHIDILLIHDIGTLAHSRPEFTRHWRDLIATGLPMLRALKADGTVRAIGLGVNEVEVSLALLDETPLDVILMANRFTLLDRRAAPVLRRLEETGGRMVAGGVFNTGILATGPVPGAMFDYEPASQAILDRVARIDAVCQAHHTDRIAAALQFPLSDPVVASVLISAPAAEMIARNLVALHAPVDPAVFRGMEDTLIL